MRGYGSVAGRSGARLTVVRVSIGGGFESTEGLSEFVVLPTQLLAP